MHSELIALTRDGLELHRAALDISGALTVEKIRSIEGVESVEWSPKGDLVALVRTSSHQKLELLDATTWEVLHVVKGPTPISKFSFSPLGRYLLVCFRFEPTQCPENLLLIETHGAREVARLPQRGVGELSWPPLRWTGGESFMCRMVKGAVHVFSKEGLASADFSINKPLFRIASERAAAFFPSPERPLTCPREAQGNEEVNVNASPQIQQRGPYCAIFSKEVKGMPAYLEIYELGENATCVAKKSFFQAQEAECQWAYDGRAVLIKTHTDASDMTYYGSSALYFLRSDGSYDTRLVAAEEGPVHAALWSPSTLEFAICHGKVPARVAVYDGSSKASSPKFCLGKGMRTSIQFCPFAKLLLWGGFGNLAGEVEIWNPRKKGIVGKTVSPSAICQWASCGSFFVTANISPRLRVDNRMSFFSLSGALLKRIDFPCLYSVQFRPLDADAAAAAAEAQKEIIRSLKVYNAGEAPLAAGAEGAAKIGNFSPSGRSLSSLTQNRSTTASSGAYKPPMASGSTSKLPPGAAEPPTTPSAAKNTRKRHIRKSRENGQGNEQADSHRAPQTDDKAKREQQEETAEQQTQGMQAGSPGSSERTGHSQKNKGEELRKKIRAVKKKLTEIERLKEKSDLNEMQQEKVRNETGLRKDLEDLENQLNSLHP